MRCAGMLRSGSRSHLSGGPEIVRAWRNVYVGSGSTLYLTRAEQYPPGIRDPAKVLTGFSRNDLKQEGNVYMVKHTNIISCAGSCSGLIRPGFPAFEDMWVRDAISNLMWEANV